MNRRLARALTYLIPLALAAALAFGAFRVGLVPAPSFLASIIGTAPCAAPVQYRIGTLDPEFHLPEAELAQDLADAAQLWNDAAGKTVIQLSATGGVPVNLIYENRQQTIELGQAISSEQAAYNAKKADVDRIQAAYASLKTAHEARVADFDTKTTSYNQEVRYWNARGGAPESEYAKLHTEQAALASQQVTLNQEVASLNSFVAQLNVATDQLNGLARATNAKVSTYNDAADTDFDQGDYVSDQEGKRILIYEFANKTSLKRVLAHELGHALGLEHVANPASIMYEQNSGTAFALSDEDRAALRQVCGTT